MAKSFINTRVHTAFTDDTVVTKTNAMKAMRPRAAATANAKTVNYTPEQTDSLLKMFKDGMAPAAIAETMGRSARSIIAKLARMKNEDGSPVYTAKAYKTKNGETVVKKEQLCDQLTELAGLTAEEADSLAKATKTALSKLVKALEA